MFWQVDIDNIEGLIKPVGMSAVLLILTVLLVQQPNSGRIDGNPDFQFVCKLGGKEASITTEDGVLVYRFGRSGRPELTIRQKSSPQNVRYRMDYWPHANSQQLRFEHGRYSYGFSSWFVAGRDGEDGVGLFVMRNGKIIRWQRCRGGDWFSEDNQFGLLPVDPLENVSANHNRPK